MKGADPMLLQYRTMRVEMCRRIDALKRISAVAQSKEDEFSNEFLRYLKTTVLGFWDLERQCRESASRGISMPWSTQ